MHAIQLWCFYFEKRAVLFFLTYVRTCVPACTATSDASQLALKMSAHAKKRKADTECSVFNKTWTVKKNLTEVKGEAVCLVCGTQVAVFKDYNLNRHYVTKHEETHKNLTDEERAREWDALLAKLQNQQGLFT